MQHYAIKIVSDLWQWFSLGIPVSSTIKIVSLNTTQAIQHYVIKFVSYFWQVCGFFLGIPVSSTNKIYQYNLIEMLLKVMLNTITLTLTLEDTLSLWTEVLMHSTEKYPSCS
jgi:hypothetical protein